MTFELTDEHADLRIAVRRFLEEKSDQAAVRRLMSDDEGYDPAVWQQMGQQLGLQGLAIPVEFGGSGSSAVEVQIVMEEMGRALLCAPFLASAVLAAQLLLELDDPAAQHDLLPGIASGATIATVALTEASGRWDPAGVTVSAHHDGGSWRLTGQKSFVLDACTAGLLLVVAATAGGIAVFAVDPSGPGVTTSALPVMDQTRKQGTVVMAAAPGRLIGQEGTGWPAVERMLRWAAVALSAEQVGGAQRALEMAVDYAKDRFQFGRPIGSFQSIKHLCADMLIRVEAARSAAEWAGWASADGRDELAVAASLAKAYCSEAFSWVAEQNIQVHGGIGYTWEHPAHLYLKRAKSSEMLFGDPGLHRAALADLVGL